MDFSFQFIHKFQSDFRQHFSSIILLAVMNERRILCYLVETNNKRHFIPCIMNGQSQHSVFQP